MSWREMFTDRELQSLIEAGLEQNYCCPLKLFEPKN